MSNNSNIYFFPTLNVCASTLKDAQTYLCEHLKSYVRLPDKSIKILSSDFQPNNFQPNNLNIDKLKIERLEIGNYLLFNDETNAFELYECSMKQFGWVYGWVSNNIQKRLKLLTMIEVKNLSFVGIICTVK